MGQRAHFHWGRGHGTLLLHSGDGFSSFFHPFLICAGFCAVFCFPWRGPFPCPFTCSPPISSAVYSLWGEALPSPLAAALSVTIGLQAGLGCLPCMSLSFLGTSSHTAGYLGSLKLLASLPQHSPALPPPSQTVPTPCPLLGPLPCPGSNYRTTLGLHAGSSFFHTYALSLRDLITSMALNTVLMIMTSKFVSPALTS